MYFKGDNAIWDAADLEHIRPVLISRVKLLSTANEEVLLMWRGYIELKYLSVVDDHGKTTEPYQDFVHRVRALRRRDHAYVKSCTKQVNDYDEYQYQVLRKKLTDKRRERGRWHLADDSQEVSACA